MATSASRWLASLLACTFCVVLCCRPAHAEETSAAARAHFERGYAFSQSGDFEQAISEFELAYATSPHFSVLFNLGQAYGASGRVVDAARTLRRYLELGGDAIDAEQRRRTDELITYYARRIGRIACNGLPKGAVVSLDGEELGTAPLAAPLEAGVGRHAISIRAPGYEPLVRMVDVKAGETSELRLALVGRVQPAPPDACSKTTPNCEAPLAQARAERAKTQKIVALAVGGGAVVLGGAAITLAIVNHSDYLEWRKKEDAFTSAFEDDPSSTSLDQLEELLSEENAIRDRDSVALGLGVAAGTLAVSSLALYLTAGSSAPVVSAAAPLRGDWPTVSVTPRAASVGYRTSF